MRSEWIGRKRAPQVGYRDVRETIRDGDIVLFRGKSWPSRVIRWITRSPYSHSGIVAWWNGRLMVLEAVPAGVLVSRLSRVVHRYSGNVELWTVDPTCETALCRSTALATAQRLIGKGYAKSKLLWIFWRMIRGQRTIDRDPEGDPVSFICSEYVSRVWREAGVDLAAHLSDAYTKPSDLARSPRLQRVCALRRDVEDTATADSLPPHRRAAGADESVTRV